ncbi:MAG: sugar phosphate nucleotidyltransferase [Candidatus Aenigmatarchaeota archaeon]
MIKSIIHAGGESTRLREAFGGPKALAPVGEQTLLSLHMQPLLRADVKDYVFTLRYQHKTVQEYVEKLERELNFSSQYIVESSPLGRAGAVKLGIDKGIIDTDNSYLMSHPDDLIPVNVKELSDYASDAEKKGKSLVMVMAKYLQSPFGVGVIENNGDIMELKQFKEKPEVALEKNHYTSTGMMMFLPGAMREFENVPLDRITHPEQHIIPKLINENKAAAFPINNWLSVNHKSDYDRIKEMGPEKLLEYLSV